MKLIEKVFCLGVIGCFIGAKGLSAQEFSKNLPLEMRLFYNNIMKIEPRPKGREAMAYEMKLEDAHSKFVIGLYDFKPYMEDGKIGVHDVCKITVIDKNLKGNAYDIVSDIDGNGHVDVGMWYMVRGGVVMADLKDNEAPTDEANKKYNEALRRINIVLGKEKQL